MTTAALVGGLYAWNTGAAQLDGEGVRADRVSSFQQLAAEDPQRALAACRPSEPNMFTALAAQLVDDETSFDDARFAHRHNGLIYLSASTLDEGGNVDAATPVWVYGSSGYAPLGHSASESSVNVAHAGALYGADPAGEAATRVRTCVLAAERAGSRQ